MPFGSLSAGERLRVLLDLQGAAAYVTQMHAASEASLGLARANRKASMESKALTQRTWLQNQALFTARRYAFYATLAVTGLAFAVARLGFSYLNAMQTSRVALQPVFKSTQALTAELNKLYQIAALSPFLFKDTVVAFRQMYVGFKGIGLSAEFTNRTISSLIDALSLAGRTTPAALNRVSVALQHMAFIGRPTGQVIYQLARDGLPIYAALHTQLKLTSDQIKNIANSGITAKQVIRALNTYIAKTPGYANAALRQANMTLQGSWAQFKDILSQAAGRSEAGLFGGLQRALAGVNMQLAPLLRAGKPITIYNIVDAIDKQLSPSTHAIMNTFQLFTGILSGLTFQFGLLAKTVQLVLYPFGLLSGQGRANEFAMKNLGRALSVLIVLWTIMKLRMLGAALGMEYLIVRTFALSAAETVLGFVTWTLAPAFLAATAAAWGFAAALLANPITWIVLGVIALTAGLVILYIRWKAFRNLVNDTAKWIWQNWKYLALFIAFIPLVGQLIAITGTLVKYWSTLARLINSAADALGRFGHFTKNAAGKAWDILKWHPLHFASGGVSPGGAAMVGERGPEMAVFPRGTRIIPNHEVNAAMAGGMGAFTIIVKPQSIYFDREKVGEVVSTVKTDHEARS